MQSLQRYRWHLGICEWSLQYKKLNNTASAPFSRETCDHNHHQHHPVLPPPPDDSFHPLITDNFAPQFTKQDQIIHHSEIQVLIVQLQWHSMAPDAVVPLCHMLPSNHSPCITPSNVIHSVRHQHLLFPFQEIYCVLSRNSLSSVIRYSIERHASSPFTFSSNRDTSLHLQ